MSENENLERGPEELDLEVADCIERALTAPADADLTDEQSAWREVWGSVPRYLEPVAPAAETWDEVCERLRRERPVPAVGVGPPANERGRLPGSARWAAVLAAGLALMATWLGNELRLRDQRIAKLQQEVGLSTAGLATPAAVPAVSAAGFGFVTANAVESCSLTAQGNVEGARGWLIMGGEEPSCFLAVEGLQPLAEGQIYRAWFRSRGEAIPLGVVELEGGRGEMFSQRIPPSIDAVFVTVEAADESLTAPTGPTVLYGDSVVASL